MVQLTCIPATVRIGSSLFTRWYRYRWNGSEKTNVARVYFKRVCRLAAIYVREAKRGRRGVSEVIDEILEENEPPQTSAVLPMAGCQHLSEANGRRRLFSRRIGEEKEPICRPAIKRELRSFEEVVCTKKARRRIKKWTVKNFSECIAAYFALPYCVALP